MTEFSRLLNVLEKELSYQEKLFSLLTKERQAIIKLNQEELKLLGEEKKLLVDESIKLESKRAEIIKSLSEPLDGQAEDTPTFSKILDKCRDSSLKRALIRLGEKLKETVGVVKSLNQGNGVLIKQSLGYIATVLSIMRARSGSEVATYSQRGRMSGAGSEPTMGMPSRSLSRAV